jgi:hypothetical protein
VLVAVDVLMGILTLNFVLLSNLILIKLSQAMPAYLNPSSRHQTNTSLPATSPTSKINTTCHPRLPKISADSN